MAVLEFGLPVVWCLPRSSLRLDGLQCPISIASRSASDDLCIAATTHTKPSSPKTGFFLVSDSFVEIRHIPHSTLCGPSLGTTLPDASTLSASFLFLEPIFGYFHVSELFPILHRPLVRSPRPFFHEKFLQTSFLLSPLSLDISFSEVLEWRNVSVLHKRHFFTIS
jgi:hypothetical protein